MQYANLNKSLSQNHKIIGLNNILSHQLVALHTSQTQENNSQIKFQGSRFVEEEQMYYMMNLNKNWYFVRLEKYQVSYLQQYMPAKWFNMPIFGKEFKNPTKNIEVYDFRKLDDVDLLNMFIDTYQEAYQEPVFDEKLALPIYIQNEGLLDTKTLESNSEYAKMNPYYREPSKKQENTCPSYRRLVAQALERNIKIAQWLAKQ